MALAGGLVALNRAEPALTGRAEAAHRAAALNVEVVPEGEIVGHSTIGVREASLKDPRAATRFLHFATLMEWDFSKEKQTPCPAPIQGLSGSRVASVGFMYPLQSGEEVTTFCLLRSTQTCCYGPSPQYNQYLLVEMPKPVRMERMAPVLVTGKFVVDPKPDEGYIYRLEGTAMQPVEDDMPEVEPAGAAAKAGLPLLDFAPLRSMEGQKERVIPQSLLDLDGQRVVVGGFCVDRTPDPLPQVMVGKEWWDGVSLGEPPTLFNSVLVLPKDAEHVPPIWKPKQTFTGTLRVEREPSRWPENGVVRLEGAERGVPGVTDRKKRSGGDPYLPVPAEAGLLVLGLLAGLGWRGRKGER